MGIFSAALGVQNLVTSSGYHTLLEQGIGLAFCMGKGALERTEPRIRDATRTLGDVGDRTALLLGVGVAVGAAAIARAMPIVPGALVPVIVPTIALGVGHGIAHLRLRSQGGYAARRDD